MNWFVLRVKINDEDREKEPSLKMLSKERKTSEESVLEALKKRLDLDVYTPFIPKKAYPHTKGGKLISTEYKICFPGYVFIETEKNANFLIKDTKLAISGIGWAHFFLSYNDNKDDEGHYGREYAMRKDEKDALESLLDENFIMESSVGLTEGDRVKIVSGPFVGRDGSVKKVNKRRMTAVVDVGMFGMSIDMTIMLEFAEKFETTIDNENKANM